MDQSEPQQLRIFPAEFQTRLDAKYVTLRAEMDSSYCYAGKNGLLGFYEDNTIYRRMICLSLALKFEHWGEFLGTRHRIAR